VACADCQAEVIVPEPTPERIARAEEMLQQPEYLQPEARGTRANRSGELTSDEIHRLAQREARLPLNEMNFAGLPSASIVARLFAVLADGVLDGLAVVVGIGLYLGLLEIGVIDAQSGMTANGPTDSLEALAAIAFPWLALKVIQWNLIATRGQTLGKMLLFIRIIKVNGEIPGFVSGVILRNWLRAALNSIPLFGLIDVLFIFTDSRRCIHDYLAGTRVVNA
jgi:uncharacterized RDD family membrane protein YckC